MCINIKKKLLQTRLLHDSLWSFLFSQQIHWTDFTTSWLQLSVLICKNDYSGIELPQECAWTEVTGDPSHNNGCYGSQGSAQLGEGVKEYVHVLLENKRKVNIFCWCRKVPSVQKCWQWYTLSPNFLSLSLWSWWAFPRLSIKLSIFSYIQGPFVSLLWNTCSNYFPFLYWAICRLLANL